MTADPTLPMERVLYEVKKVVGQTTSSSGSSSRCWLAATSWSRASPAWPRQ